MFNRHASKIKHESDLFFGLLNLCMFQNLSFCLVLFMSCSDMALADDWELNSALMIGVHNIALIIGVHDGVLVTGVHESALMIGGHDSVLMIGVHDGVLMIGVHESALITGVHDKALMIEPIYTLIIHINEISPVYHNDAYWNTLFLYNYHNFGLSAIQTNAFVLVFSCNYVHNFL